jgi:PAS domain S-box-containing protein
MKPRKRDSKPSVPQSAEGRAPIETVRDYAIFMLDPGGRVMTWNEGAAAIKGYLPGEIIGQSLQRFYPPEDVAAGKPQRLLAEAAAAGRVEDQGWRVRKDGRRFWADVVITALRDDDGRLTGFTKVTRDLTERHQADEQLRHSEELLRLLLESVKDYAIFLLDTDGRIVSWNAGAERINGYRADEVMHQHLSIFYGPDDVAHGKPERALQIALAEGRHEEEGWRIRKGGERFWASAVLTSVYDGLGRLRGFSKVTRDLTERRRAEEMLRQSENRTRLLLENIRDYAIVMLDPEGRITSWSPGAERINGYRAAEVLGQPNSIFYTGEDARAGRPSRLLDVARREGRAAEEGWRVRKDGSQFWAEVVVTRVEDPAGRLLGFANVTRDLTERQQAERQLRQSEERLRLMIDSIKDYAIFMLDPQGRVASWNPGAQRLYEYAPPEILGRPLSCFHPAAEIAAGSPQRQLEAAREHGRSEDEGWRIRKDGSRFWASVAISAIQDHGQLFGFAKVIRDMTEQRRVQEELAARAHQQAAVADLGVFALQSRDLQAVMDRAVAVVEQTLAVDMVSLLELLPDRQSLVLRAGEGWRTGLVGPGASGPPTTVSAGRTDSEAGYAIASPWPVVVEDHASERRFAETPFMRQHGVAAGLSVVVRSAGPEGQPYGVLGAHVRTPRLFRSEEVHFVQAAANVVATAIARAENEERLQRAHREADQERDRKIRAEAALRERDEFISVAAHELRTPLTALQLKLQSMEKGMQRDHPISAADTVRLASRLDGALRQTDRLGQLVERLLDVSRVVAGRFELEFADCDLSAVAREVIQELGEAADAAGTKLLLTTRGDAHGHWDCTRLHQVVSNLVSNAVKYGGGKPVAVSVERQGLSVRLTVADAGIGIAPADLQRLFGRFERAAPVRNYGGLGLGLYISRHIVEAHGGTIRVESEPGRGATFVVDLPIIDPARPDGRL